MKLSATILILMFTLSHVCGQNIFSLQHAVSIPAYDLRQYHSRASIEGITILLLEELDSSTSIGLSFGWQGFYDQVKDVIWSDNTATSSGTQHRCVDAASIHITLLYYAPSKNKVKVFGGLGMGPIYIDRSADIGNYHSQETAWGLSIKPETGIRYPVVKDLVNLQLSISHSISFFTGMGNPSLLSFNLGVTLAD